LYIANVPIAQKPTVSVLIDLQRRLAQSENKFLRGFGTLLAAAVLDRHLSELSDRQVGQLMFDEVGRDLGIAQPESTICSQATQRLFRSPGGRLEEVEVELPECPRCGNELLRHFGIEEPDYWQCVSLTCGHKIEEEMHA
jgi:hypothetical protein